MMRTHWNWLMLAALVLSVAVAGTADAQFGTGGGEVPLRGFTIDPELLGGSEAAGGKEFEVSAFVVPQREKSPALLAVRVELAPEWHIYSLSQPDGGPMPSTIRLDKSSQFRLIGQFAPLEKPEVRSLKDWPGVPVEEHYDQVTWVAPIQLSPDADPLHISVTGEVDGQVCQDGGVCIPLSFHDTTFTAKVGTAEQLASIPAADNASAQPQAIGEYQMPLKNGVIRGSIQPQVVAPGQTARLSLTVDPQDGWHVYIRADEVAKGISYRPTLIAITNASGLTVESPTADAPVVDKGDIAYHEGATTWTVNLPIPADAKPGQYAIEGQFGYQLCTDKNCDSPRAVSFQAIVDVGAETVTGTAPVSFSDSGYGIAMRALETRVPWAGEQTAVDGTGKSAVEGTSATLASLPVMIAFSLLGGLILNIMPCVLPVIGLKILSFAEQSGHDRVKAFALNAWYSAGVLSIFLLLASIAVGVGMLGQHYVQGSIFQSVPFLISMIALMVAMALSFLGTWEIPIPGFAGGGSAAKLVEQEGVMGAFFKGAFATILATPCSGPLLGPVFGFAVAQPWWVTYLIFAMIGLGMSAPYLLIGLLPKLIAFLPKPGAWMETFKQVMAFFLLGTVVYMFYILNDIAGGRFTGPALVLVVAVWFGCWLIGRTPLTASPGKRAGAWAGGVAAAVLAAFIAFNYLVPYPEGEAELYGTRVTVRETKHLKWYLYSPDILEKAKRDNKTVMIDFTAAWCPTCKLNMATAIDREQIGKFVQDNNVVPLLADYTDRSDEITVKLKELGASAIPVLAIYPAGRPNDPIILKDVISQQQLLDALQTAHAAAPSSTSVVTTARPSGS